MIKRPCTAMINSIVDCLDIGGHFWEVNTLSGGWVIVARDLDD